MAANNVQKRLRNYKDRKIRADGRVIYDMRRRLLDSFPDGNDEDEESRRMVEALSAADVVRAHDECFGD